MEDESLELRIDSEIRELKWEAGVEPKRYAALQARRGWGGAIELMGFADLYRLSVWVWVPAAKNPQDSPYELAEVLSTNPLKVFLPLGAVFFYATS